jgi:hypothetical protein
MSNDTLIKTIVTELENKIAKIACADEYFDVLNALTEIIVTTLKKNEQLSAPQAYRRATEVFADAAVAEEEEEAAEAAEEAAKAKAKAEAAAKAKRPRPARRVLKMGKLEYCQLRQRRIAARAAKRVRADDA